MDNLVYSVQNSRKEIEMASINRTPIYNLSAVLRETGLTADVLRVWERRYDLPKPQRTPGGHRLYSDYDVATLHWLRARQIEGLSISHAVKLWKNLVAAGRDPLDDQPQPAPEATLPIPGSRLDELRNRWVGACLGFDAGKADEVINQAFAIHPVETVCFEILQKGIQQVGASWYLDQATVQQEHFTTAQAVRRIETLISATPAPTRTQTVLLGCPAGEWHTFPVLLLTLLLRRRGLNVVYLGANLPLDQMKATAAAVRPDLIVLASQQLTTAAALRAAADLFQRSGVPLAYGGLIFNRVPELRALIPAHFLGETLEDSLERFEELLAAPAAFPPAVPPENPYQPTADLFRLRRAALEVRLVELLANQPRLSAVYMDTVNTFFTDDIQAALDLGEPRLLEIDLDWIKKLLAGRKLSADLLLPYLDIYRQAVELELEAQAAPITAWLDEYRARNQGDSL